MKKLHKLAAAVAVAAGIALSPQANAVTATTLQPNGAGDALLFPIYYGQFENLFTITNNSGDWIQGHLRFRGATWSTELRDFDVILSPGDVFMFRLADLDGDGQWEIDQSLDTRNFQYTGMVFDCGGVQNCLETDRMLEPTVFTNVTTQQKLEAQRNVGHIEFIGEAVLHGMTHSIMNILISGNPGSWQDYVTTNGNGKGTNAWRWSAGPVGHPLCGGPGVSGGFNTTFCDHGLRDVPNQLTGTAFISIPGQVSGLAYNADALQNFRTDSLPGTHRVENYPNNVTTTVNTNVGAGTVAATGWGNALAYLTAGALPPIPFYVNSVLGPSLPAANALIVLNAIAGARTSFLDAITAATTAAANNAIAITPTQIRTAVFTYNQGGPTSRAVILHVEDASASANFEYVYGCPGSAENRRDEIVTSFNNTWGPSLADGDSDLAAAGVAASAGPTNGVLGNGDVFDQRFRLTTLAEERIANPAANWWGNSINRYGYALLPEHVDSIRDVELAIVRGGTRFFSFYFDKGGFDRTTPSTTLKSWFTAYAPTKFFYAEDIDVAAITGSCIDHNNGRVNFLSTVGKQIGIEVWDTTEIPCSGKGTISPSNANPAVLGDELSIWNIDWMKGLSAGDKNCASFKSGRTVINSNVVANPAYPLLFYTLEVDSDGRMYNMRAMQR